MSNVEVQIEDYLHEWLDVEYVTAPVGHTSYGLEYEIKTYRLMEGNWKNTLDSFLSTFDSINKVLLYTIESLDEVINESGRKGVIIKVRLMVDGVLNVTT